MKYRTKEGDVLDLVCLTYYGEGASRVEAVLAANPGLGAMGTVLPSGAIIDLPDLPDTQTVAQIRLWS